MKNRVVMIVLIRNFVVMFLLLSIVSCGSYLKKEDTDTEQTENENNFTKKIKPAESSSPAVLALIKKARINALNGELDKAMLRLERAVRIEPANSTVWHYMAKLFLQQENYKQAAGYAAKSTSLAKGNKDLIIDNWRVIAHARYRMGNTKGAQQAQDIINKLQQ